MYIFLVEKGISPGPTCIKQKGPKFSDYIVAHEFHEGSETGSGTFTHEFLCSLLKLAYYDSNCCH
jgi:hypothetical protein